MRLLLTSAGITNPSIQNALLDLLAKPIEEASALCIPTAMHALPRGNGHTWRFISGQEPRTTMCELGWKSMDVLELTSLPSLCADLWVHALGDRRFARERRRPALSELLDAPIWSGQSIPILTGKGLRRAERRKHGHDSPHWEELRRVGASKRRR